MSDVNDNIIADMEFQLIDEQVTFTETAVDVMVHGTDEECINAADALHTELGGGLKYVNTVTGQEIDVEGMSTMERLEHFIYLGGTVKITFQ